MSSTLEGLKLKLDGLGHALYDHRLAVPMYQRSYKWTDDNIKELFHDYQRAIRDDSEYFLGTIVTAAESNTDRPEIVDGQQRLATTTILLAAIRDRFLVRGDEEGASIIETKYLLSKELRDREPVPHLRLNEFDGDFFNYYVLARPQDHRRLEAKPSRQSHRRIAAAAKIAKAHVTDLLRGASEGDHPDILNRWVHFIHEKAQVIWLTVIDYGDAYVIFETLNDRGLELSIADLLKNYLFWKSGDRVRELQQSWALMTGILETVSDDEITTYYIHQLWSSFYGITRKRFLFREVRKKVTSKQTAADLVKLLIDNAKLYVALRNPDHEHWNAYGTGVRDCLRELQLIRVWQIRTLLLAVLSKFSVSEIKKVFPLAVNWSVRFLIAGGSPGTLESIYTKQAVAVREGKVQNAKELARAMAAVVPDDAVFEHQFANIRITSDYLARYLLRRLNDAVDYDAGVMPPKSDDEAEINLEHVRPKNATMPDWPQLTQDEAEELTRRLGNMALVRAKVNSKIGNASFKVKQVAFQQEPRPLTKDIANYTAWERKQIDEYQGKLAKIAVKVWKLNG